MALKRRRKVGMAAAGLLTAATPLVLGQQAAGAAVTTDEDSVEITFVATSTGETITCTAGLEAVHDTDDPDQPELRIGPWLSGPGVPCIDATARITASYEDQDGIIRTTRIDGSGAPGGVVQGAYSNTSVTVEFSYDDCQSSVCGVTLTASPK